MAARGRMQSSLVILPHLMFTLFPIIPLLKQQINHLLMSVRSDCGTVVTMNPFRYRLLTRQRTIPLFPSHYYHPPNFFLTCLVCFAILATLKLHTTVRNHPVAKQN